MTPYVMTVASTYSREFPNKFKPGATSRAYSFTSTGGDKVDCGFTDPGLNAGDVVEFMGDSGQYGIKVVKGTLKHSSKTPVEATDKPAGATGGATRTGGSGGASGRPFPVPSASGEMAIIRQNALTNAVQFFNSQYYSTDTENPTIIEKADMVIELAYKFAEFSSGQREVKAAQEILKNKAIKNISALGESLDAAVKGNLE